MFMAERGRQRKDISTAGNREQGTGNREQGTGNREQGTGRGIPWNCVKNRSNSLTAHKFQEVDYLDL